MSSETSSTKSTPSTQNSTKSKLKKSHYRDLFNQYFFTIFQRRLQYLYLPYVKDNIYILSSVPPYELLADNHNTVFACVNLNGADPVFKDLVRNWISNAFGNLEVCIRIDFYSTATNKCFGNRSIPGQELIPTKGVMPVGKYPKMAVGFDKKEECTYYTFPSLFGEAPPTPPEADLENEDEEEELEEVVETDDNDTNPKKKKHLKCVAWEASQGYAKIPVMNIFKTFKIYLTDDKVARFDLDKTFPKDEEVIKRGNQAFHFKPLIGYDSLDLKKVEVVKSELLAMSVSNRAITTSHHAITKDGVEVIITRPNCVLYPFLYLKESVNDSRGE